MNQKERIEQFAAQSNIGRLNSLVRYYEAESKRTDLRPNDLVGAKLRFTVYKAALDAKRRALYSKYNYSNAMMNRLLAT